MARTRSRRPPSARLANVLCLMGPECIMNEDIEGAHRVRCNRTSIDQWRLVLNCFELARVGYF